MSGSWLFGLFLLLSISGTVAFIIWAIRRQRRLDSEYLRSEDRYNAPSPDVSQSEYDPPAQQRPMGPVNPISVLAGRDGKHTVDSGWFGTTHTVRNRGKKVARVEENFFCGHKIYGANGQKIGSMEPAFFSDTQIIRDRNGRKVGTLEKTMFGRYKLRDRRGRVVAEGDKGIVSSMVYRKR